jgi:hypothetical protein
MGLAFFRGGGSSFVCLPCSQCVLNMFSSCSHEVLQVSKLFPKTFLIAPQFYPIWFAQSSTLIYIYWKGRLYRNTFVFILQQEVQRGASIGEWLNVPKKTADGPMNITYSKQKQNKNVSNPWTLYNESHYVKAIHLSYSLDKAPPKFNFVFLQWANLIGPSS